MKIREANLNDVDGIAEVHLHSWKTTYTGIISESYLSRLSFEKRRKNWIWTFHHPNQDEAVFIAEDANRNVIEFSNSGKSRNPELDYDGELYSIYLLKQYQGLGIGRLLFGAAVDALKIRGYKSMMLWVLEGNPSLDFYQRMGGTVIGKKDIVIGEDQLTELSVGWKEI